MVVVGDGGEFRSRYGPTERPTVQNVPTVPTCLHTSCRLETRRVKGYSEASFSTIQYYS